MRGIQPVGNTAQIDARSLYGIAYIFVYYGIFANPTAFQSAPDINQGAEIQQSV